MSEKILDRLRTERQLALNGDKQIMARSFDMAISEIERLAAENRTLRNMLVDGPHADFFIDRRIADEQFTPETGKE